MRLITLIPLVGVALLAILAVGLAVHHGQGELAQAQPPFIVGIDMDPTGNSCPNDCVDPGGVGYCTLGTDCSLGDIDTCKAVTAGNKFQFDVFLNNIPPDDGATDICESWLGGRYRICEEDDKAAGTIAEVSHTNAAYILTAQPGSSITNMSDAPKALPTCYRMNVADMGYAEYAPAKGIFTQGVLGRYEFTVAAGASGLYGLTLETIMLGADTMVGCFPGNIIPDQVRDARYSPAHGLIAVDSPCPEPVTTPTATPTGTPTPLPTGTPTPLPTGTPVPPATLASGWNHVCYVGPDQAIGEALAQISQNLVAAYRLKPDQRYDKWFPARPEISTITDLSPYEPLFLLLTNDALWAQEPWGSVPTSVALVTGWNSACYSGPAKDVDTATESISGRFGALYVLALDQTWRRFVPGRPEVSNLTSLDSFTPVLLLVPQEGGAQWLFDP